MRVEEYNTKSGYFWLPGQGKEKIPGTLTISDGGDIELEIVGHFEENINPFSIDDNIERIVGFIEKDGPVTLDDCFYVEKNTSFGSISKSRIIANMVLSGVEYNRDESVEFNTLSFSMDCFDEWVGISGITVNNNLKDRSATIQYKLPKNLAFQLDNGMQLEICFEYKSPGYTNKTEVKISQRAYFKLTSKNLNPLNDFLDIAYKLANLMCFAIDATVALKTLIATSPEIKMKFGGDKETIAPVRVFYPSIPFSEKAPKKNRHQMLFDYRNIEEISQDMFNNWINAYEKISPALSLYFSTKTRSNKYLDERFLALAQGLETYHRRTSNEKLMDPSAFESLVTKIAEGCPDAHREWLNGRLMHGNEISLRKRMTRIIEPFKNHIGSNKDRNRLTQKIVDTRNYLTHYNEDLKNKVAGGEDLWILCQKMEAIFQLHFLKVSGFNDVHIESLIKTRHSLRKKLSK